MFVLGAIRYRLGRTFLLFMFLLTLLLPATAWGWTADGHKIVALIVWDELTPAAKTEAIKLLKQHPRYEADLQAGLPPGSNESDAERYAFAVAATWPDLVKSPANPMHFVANHPQWHYIDLPYHPEGGSDEYKPPMSPTSHPSAASEPRDIVEALEKNAGDLRSTATTPQEKAIAICWLLHLGGDIHQPLHAIQMFSPQFPDGDRGGNALLVLREPPYPNTQMNLHLLWDELPGNYATEQPIAYLAAGLRADPNLSREHFKEALAITNFSQWAHESHDLAVKYAYLNGTLKAATAFHGHANPSGEVPGVPIGYLKQAEEVAFQRVALAGYRTADLLNSLLDPRQPKASTTPDDLRSLALQH